MTTTNLSTPKTTCPVCGASGDLVPELRYLGGHGYVSDLVCRDRSACWGRVWQARYEEQTERDADLDTRWAAEQVAS